VAWFNDPVAIQIEKAWPVLRVQGEVALGQGIGAQFKEFRAIGAGHGNHLPATGAGAVLVTGGIDVIPTTTVDLRLGPQQQAWPSRGGKFQLHFIHLLAQHHTLPVRLLVTASSTVEVTGAAGSSAILCFIMGEGDVSAIRTIYGNAGATRLPIDFGKETDRLLWRRHKRGCGRRRCCCYGSLCRCRRCRWSSSVSAAQLWQVESMPGAPGGVLGRLCRRLVTTGTWDALSLDQGAGQQHNRNYGYKQTEQNLYT
jgi:hypothetical protein